MAQKSSKKMSLNYSILLLKLQAHMMLYVLTYDIISTWYSNVIVSQNHNIMKKRRLLSSRYNRGADFNFIDSWNQCYKTDTHTHTFGGHMLDQKYIAAKAMDICSHNHKRAQAAIQLMS